MIASIFLVIFFVFAVLHALMVCVLISLYGLKYLLTDDYTLGELGVDEARILVRAVSVAGTALVLGKIVAFGAGLLSLPVTVPISLSILAFSVFGVWLIDKETDFEKNSWRL